MPDTLEGWQIMSDESILVQKNPLCPECKQELDDLYDGDWLCLNIDCDQLVVQFPSINRDWDN